MSGTYSLGPRDINGPCLSDGHTSGIQPQRIQERLGMSAFIVVAFGGNFVSDPRQSVFLPHLAGISFVSLSVSIY